MDELERIYAFARLSPRVATAGQPSEAQLELIARAGFQVVINLARVDSPRALADERLVVERCGLRYVHLPIDFQAPSLDVALSFFEVLRNLTAQRVFIHCAANMRVSALMSVYRVVYEGVPEAEARAEVLDIWTPNEVWERYLREVEQAARASLIG